MEIQYGNTAGLNWLWLVVACALAIIVGFWLRRRSARRFATADMLAQVSPLRDQPLHWFRSVFIIVSLLALVVCVVDLRWGKVWQDVPQKGIEVMFVLDVSRSMLAEDVTPSRLERAKQLILDTVDEMAGDRVGLVVFAGEARQKVPLTSHYDAFKQSLDEVSPSDVHRGGSRLGDAIALAADGFLDQTGQHKAMILITDGEDHESLPVQAAKKAKNEHGVRVFTIGLGDMSQGARIPTQSGRSDFVRHDGEIVWSKLDGAVLESIATATEGAFIPAGTKRVNMAKIYHGLIMDVPQTEFETQRINRYEARFQWFLAPALILLVLETLIATRRAKKQATDRDMDRDKEHFGDDSSLGEAA